MVSYKNHLKSLYRTFLGMSANKKLEALLNENRPSTRNSVGIAIRDTIQNRMTPAEKMWIEKIEDLRNELSHSKIRIEMPDYGAGSLQEGPECEEEQTRFVSRTVKEIAQASKSPYWARLLFNVIRNAKPDVCLELGTCLGISASYQAAALSLNQAGKLVTLEGAEPLAALSQEHFRRLELANIEMVVGRFQDHLDRVLNEHRPINYAFIDGHHQEKATLDYFERIYPYVSEKAVLVFDDIAWSAGMKRAWQTIEADKRVNASINLSKMGICIIDNEIEDKQIFEIPMV